jgi:TatD DNase family protein
MAALISAVRFVGEVGLDYTTGDNEARARQRAVFAEILDRCSTAGDKVITVHSRRAAADAIAVVGPRYAGRVILHWFSGTKGELERAISYGLFFSVNPSMLTTAKGRDLVARMPQDRVLLESDGPFVRERGGTASPLGLATTLTGLATHWRVSPRRASEIVAANFKRIAGARSDA